MSICLCVDAIEGPFSMLSFDQAPELTHQRLTLDLGSRSACTIAQPRGGGVTLASCRILVRQKAQLCIEYPLKSELLL